MNKEQIEHLTRKAVLDELSQTELDGMELLDLDEVLNVVILVVKNCAIPDVSKRFSSEGEILQWLYLNTPLAIKAKSKHAKTMFVNPFTSKHAFEEVCKHLANKMYNAR